MARGRPKKKWIWVIGENMKTCRINKNMVRNRVGGWRGIIRIGDPTCGMEAKIKKKKKKKINNIITLQCNSDVFFKVFVLFLYCVIMHVYVVYYRPRLLLPFTDK